MVLQGLGVGEVDRVGLVGILGYVAEVKTKGLTKTTELDLALMLQAEAECLLGNLLKYCYDGFCRVEDGYTHLVYSFEPRVIFERL